MLGEAPHPINVLLFAITRVTRFGQREEEEEKKKKKRKKRREGTKQRWNAGPPSFAKVIYLVWWPPSMRGHSNLAIFARPNLKKHERLTPAKTLLIIRV